MNSIMLESLILSLCATFCVVIAVTGMLLEVIRMNCYYFVVYLSRCTVLTDIW